MYNTVPDRADNETLVLIELRKLPDVQGFFHSSFVQVHLPIYHHTLFAINSVVILYAVLCHTRPLHLSIPAISLVFGKSGFKGSSSFSKYDLSQSKQGIW